MTRIASVPVCDLRPGDEYVGQRVTLVQPIGDGLVWIALEDGAYLRAEGRQVVAVFRRQQAA
jgi:hypothetical protein